MSSSDPAPFLSYSQRFESQNYPNFTPLFTANQRFTTRLPKSAAMIRTGIALAFSSLAIALRRSPFIALPVAALGLAGAAWTVYSQFVRQDPLIEVFTKIVGKEAFEEIQPRNSKTNFFNWLRNVEWDDVKKNLISKIRLPDGRLAILVKARVDMLQYSTTNCMKPKILIGFVERLGPDDLFSEKDHDRPLTRAQRFFSLFKLALGYKREDHSIVRVNLRNELGCSDVNPKTYEDNDKKVVGVDFAWGVKSTLSGDTANLLAAQLQQLAAQLQQPKS